MCYADSVVVLEKERKNTSRINYPLLNWINQAFSQLHTDNFVDLAPLEKKSLQQDFTKHKIFTVPKTTFSDRPKVLLIMDDLSQPSQIEQLENLPLNITPSLFPKTVHNSNTPRLAERLAKNGRIFMVHLPLEAQQFIQHELEPIKVGTHKEVIKREIMRIKEDFPSLVYINNHTGSKFTQSYSDMRNLLDVFDELGLKFIDSVTTGSIVSQHIAKEREKLIMARDVFLDNKTTTAYVKAQITSLILKARKKGYAIAICHPNAGTFKALAQMSDEINMQVELVSPKDLESYLIENNTTHYVRAPFNY